LQEADHRWISTFNSLRVFQARADTNFAAPALDRLRRFSNSRGVIEKRTRRGGWRFLEANAAQ
jgi:hypothetical protein